MSRGALEAMLSVTGQQEFAASMAKAMGQIKEMGVAAESVSKQMATAGAKMDAAFTSPARLSGMRSMNGELSTMKGHLKSIVGMLGGAGLLTSFGLFEGVKNAAKVQTNAMQWVAEASVPQGNVAGLQRLASQQAGLGINQIDAGGIVRQVESAYGGNAKTPLIQSFMTNTSNLSAISGGKLSAYDAASLLIPAIQADPKLNNDPTRAAAIINAMVGSGNMQTSDAIQILGTPAVGTLSGLGIGLEALAPVFAFGADTRGGVQAAPFARTMVTSLLNLSRGGANNAGKKDLMSMLGAPDEASAQSQIIKMLDAPNGVVDTMNFIMNKASGLPGGLSGGAAKNALEAIYGGTRGGAGPLSIAGNRALFDQKSVTFAMNNDTEYYKRAARDAQANPAQQGAIVAAGFSNLMTNLGIAVLPLLTKAVPAVTTMFKVMGDPNVIKFAELMIGLKGVSMLNASIGGGVGSIATQVAAAKAAKEAGGIRKGLTAWQSARRGVTIAGGVETVAGAAGGTTLLPAELAVAAAAGGVWAINNLDKRSMSHDTQAIKDGRVRAKKMGVENPYGLGGPGSSGTFYGMAGPPPGDGHTFLIFGPGSVVQHPGVDSPAFAKQLANEIAKKKARS